MPRKEPEVSKSEAPHPPGGEVSSNPGGTRMPDITEGLRNADTFVRGAILGKGERVPVIAASNTIAQVEHFDISMSLDHNKSDNVTLEDAAQERPDIRRPSPIRAT